MAALKNDMPKDKRESFGSQPADSNALAGPLTKTEKPYTVSAGIDVDGEKVMLTVIDTPGFQSDYLIDKQLHDIIGYIEHQFDLTLAEVNIFDHENLNTGKFIRNKEDAVRWGILENNGSRFAKKKESYESGVVSILIDKLLSLSGL